MVQNSDEIEKDDVAVDVPVSNPENDSVSKEATKQVEKEVSNSQNIHRTVEVNKEVIHESLEPNVRENVVSRATEFILASSSRGSTKDQTINFLRSKGLTEKEIQESIDRTVKVFNDKTLQKPVPDDYYSNYVGTIQPSYHSQSWFRRIFGSLAYYSIVSYIGYQIYKKYIKPWLFGKKNSPLEIRLAAVESSMQRCIMLLEEKISASESSNRSIELDHVHAELKSIKSLLLNKSQFPPIPTLSSIPQWQLPKTTKPQEELISDTKKQTVECNKQKELNGTSSHLSHTTNVVASNIPNTINEYQFTSHLVCDETDSDANIEGQTIDGSV